MRKLTLYPPDLELLKMLAEAPSRVLAADIPKDHRDRGTMSRLVRSGHADQWGVGGLVTYGITDAGRVVLGVSE